MKVLLLFVLFAFGNTQEDPCAACPFPEIFNHTETVGGCIGKTEEKGNVVMIRHAEAGGCFLSLAGCQYVELLLADNMCTVLTPLFPYRCVNGFFEYSSSSWSFQTKKVRCY